MRPLESGALVAVEYEDEPAMFHQRLVLLKASPEKLLTTTGEPLLGDGASVFWILTPTGDIYPEELRAPPLAGLIQLDQSGVSIRGTMVPAGRRLRQVFGFVEGRGAGALTPLVVIRALEAANLEELRPTRRTTLPPPGVTSSRGSLPALENGLVWRCEGPANSGVLREAIAVDDGVWTRLGEWLLVRAEGGVLCCRATAGGGSGSAAAAAVDEEPNEVELDARVFSISREPGGKRRRNFRDAAELLLDSEWDGWPI